MAELSPRARRIQLGLVVKQYRDRLGMTQEQLATELGWYSAVKASKVERGAVSIDEDEVEGLARVLQLDPDSARHLVELASAGRGRNARSHSPEWLQSYNALVAFAPKVKIYAAENVPGPLQTRSTAEKILRSSLITPARNLDSRVDERMYLADRVRGPHGPELIAVLGEATLRRRVGDTAAWHEQLVYLREVAGLDHVTLRVLPFRAGTHPAADTPFMIFEQDDPPYTWIYREGLTAAEYLERATDVTVYKMAFEHLLTTTTDTDTLHILDDHINQLGKELG